MQQGNWANKSTAEYYMHIRAVLGSRGVSSVFSGDRRMGPSGAEYTDYDSLRDALL